MRDVSQHSSLLFTCTPDPTRLFMSASHEAALQAIRSSIEERRGFVAILGLPGVGKTTIIHTYLKHAAPPQCITFSLLYPKVAYEEILQAIGQQLGLQAAFQDIPSLLEALRQYLIQMQHQGHVFILILDEAQQIPVQTLLALLQFSDAMQMASERLVQMVFLGQSAFEQQLQLPELQPLRQVLDLQVTIESLTDAESRVYIQQSLEEAAVPADERITDEGLRQIIERANGIPRVINTLCLQALLALPDRQPYSPPSLQSPQEVLAVSKPKPRSAGRRWALSWAVGAILVVGCVWYALHERLLDQADHIRKEVLRLVASRTSTHTIVESPGAEADAPDLPALWEAGMGMESAVLTPISVSQVVVETERAAGAGLSPDPRRVSEKELLGVLLASPESAPPVVVSTTTEPPRAPTAVEPPDLLRQVVALMQQWQPDGGDFVLHMVPSPVQSVYMEGAKLSVHVEAEISAYLYVDYYQANGDVVHLLPNSLDNNWVDADRAFVIGGSEMTYGFDFTSPFGEELLTVIASEHPLEGLQQLASMIEPASAYLSRLAAYFKERKSSGKVAIAHMVIRTSQGN